MLRRSLRRLFHSQRDTPVLPQVPVPPVTSTPDLLRVSYFLYRNAVVKHDPHPLEFEMSFLMEREHNRYARHPEETATHFLASRGHSMDSWNRSDPEQIKRKFFNLDAYDEVLKIMTQRYTPEPRVGTPDFFDPFSPECAEKPPKRYAVNRRLNDYLYFIVQFKESGKWGLPTEERESHETLRMTLDRALFTQLGETLDTFVWSNSPAAVLKKPMANQDKKKNNSIDEARKKEDEGEREENKNENKNNLEAEKICFRDFIFPCVYLSGRPSFDMIRPAISDHAWVTRREIAQYRKDFEHPELVEILEDISLDSIFETE